MSSEAEERRAEFDARDVKMTAILKAFLPCPFCGWKLENDLWDTLYPTGLLWKKGDQGWNEYIRHADSKNIDRNEYQPMYQAICSEVNGGCGAEMHGHTIDEVREKWNRRT